MATHTEEEVKSLARLDAVDVFKLAVERSGKTVTQVRQEMGWGEPFARKVFSTAKFFPSFPELPRFCAVVGNTLVAQWIQLRAMTAGLEDAHEAVTCESLIGRIGELFAEMGDVGQRGADAIRDFKLEPRELRGIIREINDVIDKSMDLVADLRAMERELTEEGQA